MAKAFEGLTSTAGDRVVPIIVWVPSADRDGKPRTDQEEWKEKALLFLAELFGKGATAMPAADGVWLNPQTKQVVRERPILIYCYVTEQQVSDASLLHKLGQFCYDMGIAMYQGEVALLIGERLLFINTF